MDEKLIDEKRKTITKIIITNENIRLRVIVDPCGTCQKQNGMPHAAKSKYINNNTYINITRLKDTFFSWDAIMSLQYAMDVKYDLRETYYCARRIWAVIRLFGVFSVKNVPCNIHAMAVPYMV